MVSVLFVCLGNICRSPLAEAIFKHQVRQKGMQAEFVADSCGTANYHIGHLPDPRTLDNAARNGISIEHHGRQFQVADFERFDLIVPMDRSNQTNLLRLPGASLYRPKLKLMRTFDPEKGNEDVPDPYYGTAKDFQAVFEILDRSIDGLIKSLENPLVKWF